MPNGHVQPCRVHARHDRRSRRRAHGRRYISLGEFHRALAESVDVRSLVQIRAITSKIRPSEIIDNN